MSYQLSNINLLNAVSSPINKGDSNFFNKIFTEDEGENHQINNIHLGTLTPNRYLENRPTISNVDNNLELMNRSHNSNQAKRSVELAKKYFDNISIDLIYGIPGLTDDDWKKNIEIAKKFKLPHISAYALTVEPHTILKKLIDKGKINNVNDEILRAQNEIIVLELEKGKNAI